MINYVLGFAFDTDLRIALIKKDRPASMAGRWNGIGGKVEPGEAPIEAMMREFSEEAGVKTTEFHWQHFATLRDKVDGYQILCFVTILKPEELDLVSTQESEEVRIFGGDVLVRQDIELMTNLNWLIPMSLALAEKEIPVLIDCASAEVSAVRPIQNALR